MFPLESILLAWLATLGYMVLIFFLAMRLKDNSIVDIAYGIGFLIAVGAVHSFLADLHPRQILVTALLALWALRLSWQILIVHRARGGEDFRYKEWRNSWGRWFVIRSFFQIYVLQGTFIILVALPILLILLLQNQPLGWLDLLGVLLWGVGFLFEAVGDWQKLQFKREQKNKGKILTTGLWRYSRHPNYFGESLQWWGFFVLSLNVMFWYISLLSPLLITWFLLRVSGIPMLEAKYDRNKEYQAYKTRTNAFFPWAPKR